MGESNEIEMNEVSIEDKMQLKALRSIAFHYLKLMGLVEAAVKNMPYAANSLVLNWAFNSKGKVLLG